MDTRDGSVYLAVTGEQPRTIDLRKYDKTGRYLFDVDLPHLTTWLTVDPLTGDLWVPDSFRGAQLRRFRIDARTHQAELVVAVNHGGSAPGQINWLTGVAADGNGNVYVADVGNNVVHSYDHDGRWRFDFGRAELSGDVRGLVADTGANRLYVANAGAGTIEVFTLTGKHVRSMAGPGSGAGQFVDGARQLSVTPDGKVWGADYGLRRVISFTAGGAYSSTFPPPTQPIDAAGLSQGRAVDVDRGTGDILVADAWGQRVMRFTDTGVLLASVGRRGSTPPQGMNYPKSVAVDQATGTVWVANYEGAPYLVGYNPGLTRVVGRMTIPRFINDIEVRDGLAYAVERDPGTLHVYELTTGHQVWGWDSTIGRLRGIGVDFANGNRWVTAEDNNTVAVVDESAAVVAQLPLGGTGWGVAVRGNLVYVAVTTTDRVEVFDRRTFVHLGGFGTSGTDFGQLGGPSGLAFDRAGSLVVMEEGNDRVQVFADRSRGTERTPPTTTLTSTRAGSQVVLSGKAEDAGGVAGVQAQVQDLVSGRYFDVMTNSWSSSPVWNAGIVWGAATSAGWRFTVVATVPSRSYAVLVRSEDRSGNRSAPIRRTVAVP